MKKILNIYHKDLKGELLGAVYTFEEFVYVKFNNMYVQWWFHYPEFINWTKEKVKDWYYFTKWDLLDYNIL